MTGVHVTATAPVVAGARWPEGPTDTLPDLPGFTAAPFHRLVAEVAERCLRRRYRVPPAPDGGKTGVVVVTAAGDATSAGQLAALVRSDEPIDPVLFHQGVPNSVIGYVTARWGLAGPVACICPVADPRADGLGYALTLIRDGDADQALVILAEEDGDRGVAGTASALLVRGRTR
jgi:hypothetical protein